MAAFSSEVSDICIIVIPAGGNIVRFADERLYRYEQDKSVPQEALIRALKIYSPSEKASSCQLILHATHALLVASMQLCRCPPTGDVREFTHDEGRGKAELGVFWTCFLIEHMPMVRPYNRFSHFDDVSFSFFLFLDTPHGPRPSIPIDNPFPPYIHTPPPALASLTSTLPGSVMFGFTVVGDVGHGPVCGIAIV